MIRGLYTSALGMETQMKKMDVVTNNIANADTTGFKRDIVVTQSFSEELMKRLNYSAGLEAPKAVGGVRQGVFVNNVFTDFSPGNLEITNNSLNLAISGDGFFSVGVANADGDLVEHFTRNGAFSLSSERVLQTLDGNPVIGQNGIITLPEGEFTIDSGGNIFINGEFADKILMSNVEDKTTLRKVGSDLYAMTEESAAAGFNGQVMQGFLEKSNVNSVREMVDMIALSRVYEANQRAVTLHDTMLGRAVNDIAKR